MRKKIGGLAAILLMTLCLIPVKAQAAEAHVHCVCGGTEHAGSTSHNKNQTWTGVTELTNDMSSGYYYLLNDVELEDFWKPQNNVNLCLNGHSIFCKGGEVTYNGSSVGKNVPTIWITGKSLTVTDCNDEPGKISHLKNGTNWNSDNKGRGAGVEVGPQGSFTMYNGIITENTVVDSARSTYDGFGGGVYLTSSSAKFKMYGGKITGNEAHNGSGVYNQYGGFDMYGGEITGNVSRDSGGGKGSCVYNASYDISAYGGAPNTENCHFRMYGGTISGNRSENMAYNVQNEERSTFEMYGGTIGNNGSGEGMKIGGVHNKGIFKLIDGAITGNNTNRNGAGVWNDGWDTDNVQFIMTGGSITNNSTITDGGGIYSSGAKATVTVSGGEISGNSAERGGGIGCLSILELKDNVLISNNTAQGGGGVYMSCDGSNRATFTMSGSKNGSVPVIKNNKATQRGGGVCVWENASMIMNAGCVEGNSALTGGGVFVWGSREDSFTMDNTVNGGADCIIANNTATGTGLTVAGGLYVYTDKSCVLKGNPRIENNTVNGKANNFFVPQQGKVEAKNLSEGAMICIAEPYQSGSSTDTYIITSDDANKAYFKADKENYIIDSQNNVLVWKMQPRKVQIDLPEGVQRESGGELYQEVEYYTYMTKVVLKASEGYYFKKDDYPRGRTDAIYAKWTSSDTVEVLGFCRYSDIDYPIDIKVSKMEPQTPPDALKGVGPTTEDGVDGQITGTTTAMEWSADGGETWKNCTDKTTTVGATGSYQIRYKAAEGKYASVSVTVEVPEVDYAPLITGIEENGVYCESVEFTVKDKNLVSVKANDKPLEAKDGKYVLAPGKYTVVAADETGHTTTVSVTVNEKHSLTNVSYSWNDDYTSCTANAFCDNCKKKVEETAVITTKITQKQSCTDVEKTEYTAAFENSAFKEQKQEKETKQALGHAQGTDDGDCTTPVTCTRCGQVLIEAKAHKFGGELQSDVTGHWTKCHNDGCTQREKKEHTPDIAAPTEDQDQKCTECGWTIAAKLGHQHRLHLEKVEAKDPTCTEDGNKEYYYCKDDNWYFEDENAQKHIEDTSVVTLPATGHDYSELTYTWSDDNTTCTAVLSCTKCKDVKADEKVNSASKVTKEATCTEPEITTYTAEFKDPTFAIQNKEAETQKAHGHHYEEWIVDKEATVTSTGSKHRVCEVCKDIEIMDIEKLPPVAYKIIEGADGTYTVNIDGTYTIRANGEFNKFVNVEIDGKVVDSKYYTAKSGSTVITFSKEYMDIYSVGQHTVKVNFEDGSAETTLTVAQKDAGKTDSGKKDTGKTGTGKDSSFGSAKTGDNSDMIAWFILLIASVCILGSLRAIRKQRR